MLFIRNLTQQVAHNLALSLTGNAARSILGAVCLAACLTAFGPIQAFAQDTATSNSAADEVVIRKGGNGETYYEYRVGGQIKEIRVVPKQGKTYYLVPQDGQYIKMDRSQLLVPSWIIFEW